VTGHSTERWSHWTTEGSVRIESRLTPSGTVLYVPIVKLKDTEGNDRPCIHLPIYRDRASVTGHLKWRKRNGKVPAL
jgi:hypothetical protein